MWNHDYPAMHQLVQDRHRELMAAGERSRLRRAVRRQPEHTVHRPSKTR